MLPHLLTNAGIWLLEIFPCLQTVVTRKVDQPALFWWRKLLNFFAPMTAHLTGNVSTVRAYVTRTTRLKTVHSLFIKYQLF